MTEDDASPKKKRVLVKKHRKKTRSEKRESKAKGSDDNANCIEEDGEERRQHFGANNNDWSSEDEDVLAMSDRSRRPMVVYVSSYDRLEGAATDKPLQNEVGEDVASANNEKLMMNLVADANVPLWRGSKEDNEPVIVYDPDNLGPGGELPQVQGQGSTVDPEATGEVGVAHEKDNIACALKLSNINTVVERGQKVDCTEASNSALFANDTTVGREDSKDIGLNNEENKDVGNEDDKDAMPCDPESKLAPDESPKISKDDPSLEEGDASSATSLNSGVFGELTTNESMEEVGPVSDHSPPNTAALSPRKTPDTPPLFIVTASPKFGYLSPCDRASADEMDTALTPRMLNLPDLSDVDEDSDGDEVDKGPILSSNDDEDDDGIPEVHSCGSSVTEVTSNVDGPLKGATREMSTGIEGFKLEPLRRPSLNDTTLPSSLFAPYQTKRTNSEGNSTLSSAGLGVPIPMNSRMESFKSTGSATGSTTATSAGYTSYFSYEDVSVTSEDSEMCAICLCPYEEGDVRIFSKSCPHAFHKECILEWLVKGHDECPCCRKNMVTKSEIKDVSASLLGTEKLARALAVVESSEMQEAPPLRRGIRRTRQMLARAREQAMAHASPQMPPESPGGYSHWLWNARFEQPPNSPSANVITPDALPPGLSPMPRLNEARTHSAANRLSPRPSHRGPGNDWLWATRFVNTPQQAAPAINPSRSSDAIMNPHETNTTSALVTREATPMHTDVGPLFTSTLHDHWQRQQQRQNPQTTTTRSTMHHNHWQQQQSPQTPAARPATLHHSHWQQQQRRQSPQALTTRPTTLHHSHWQQQNSQTSIWR